MSNEFVTGDMVDVAYIGIEDNGTKSYRFIGATIDGTRFVLEGESSDIHVVYSDEVNIEKSKPKLTPIIIPDEIWREIDDKYVALLMNKSGKVFLVEDWFYEQYVKCNEYSSYVKDLQILAGVVQYPLKVDVTGVNSETSLTLRPSL